ncbi:hypothetical protein ACFO9E_25650 [Streptomyces maoxianensis]|uniref:Uncharacterized protein n=1 Tax=Streptomyces maoxianensis TaxID=1459942 RepID=A0ABV9GDM5_9ACTN
MTSAECRARAVELLTAEGQRLRPRPEDIAEAAVWASLATAAAIEESSSKDQ